MTLVELQYLTILAQELHFGRAAARCGVSQPALSMAVRKVESDLGVQLFERSKSGISITTLGEQIITQARRIIAQTEVIKNLADAGIDQLSGTLNIGVISTLAPYLVPALISQLGLMANTLNVHIEESHGDDLHHKLHAGNLDVILVSQPYHALDFVNQHLFTEPLVMLMNSKHPLAAKHMLQPLDCHGQTLLVLDERHCLREQVLNVFASLSKKNKPNFRTCSSLETIRHMVAAGLGIAVLPLSATNTALYANHLLHTRGFAEPQPMRTLALTWRSSFPRHKTIDVLRNALQICSWQFTTAHDNSGQGLLVENDSW